MCGSEFFAQGVEGITGCSVLHGTMILAGEARSVADWWLRLENGTKAVTVRLRGISHSGPAEVLGSSDDLLFLPSETGAQEPVVWRSMMNNMTAIKPSGADFSFSRSFGGSNPFRATARTT